MASSTQRLLLALTIFIGVLSISASGRPCKTLFISSYSIHFNPRNPNPNSENPAGFVTIFTEIRQFSPRRPLIFLDHPILPSMDDREQHLIHEPKRRVLPFEYDFSSLRDRTKDILSVVVALLFGVGCGSLTAVTMYLVWSLFANRHDSRNSYEEFSDVDDHDDDLSPKKMGYEKMGYEKIPAKEAAWGGVLF